MSWFLLLLSEGKCETSLCLGPLAFADPPVLTGMGADGLYSSPFSHGGVYTCLAGQTRTLESSMS